MLRVLEGQKAHHHAVPRMTENRAMERLGPVFVDIAVTRRAPSSGGKNLPG